MGFQNLVAIASSFRPIRSLLLGIQALLTTVVLVYLRQHFVD